MRAGRPTPAHAPKTRETIWSESRVSGRRSLGDSRAPGSPPTRSSREHPGCGLGGCWAASAEPPPGESPKATGSDRHAASLPPSPPLPPQRSAPRGRQPTQMLPSAASATPAEPTEPTSRGSGVLRVSRLGSARPAVARGVLRSDEPTFVGIELVASARPRRRCPCSTTPPRSPRDDSTVPARSRRPAVRRGARRPEHRPCRLGPVAAAGAVSARREGPRRRRRPCSTDASAGSEAVSGRDRGRDRRLATGREACRERRGRGAAASGRGAAGRRSHHRNGVRGDTGDVAGGGP